MMDHLLGRCFLIPMRPKQVWLQALRESAAHLTLHDTAAH